MPKALNPVILRRSLKPPLGLDNSWGVCSQSQRAGNQPLQAGDEKSSPFRLEAQLLGRLACEHGAEKSRHYRFRDLLYCGVSLRQPRPRLHPKKAYTLSLAEKRASWAIRLARPCNNLFEVSRRTNKQHLPSVFSIPKSTAAPGARMAFNKILGPRCVFSFGCNHALRAPRLTGRKGSSQSGTKTRELASRCGGCIDRRDISSFNGILAQP
jgi:hypothetical protein